MSLPVESDENWFARVAAEAEAHLASLPDSSLGPAARILRYGTAKVGLESLMEHIEKNCDAVVALHEPGQLDISGLLAEGWTLEAKVDYVAGKRIRYIHPPQE